MQDVRGSLTRLFHFNDGVGLYTPDGGTFREGVVPGKGEIKELEQILQEINFRKIPFVIEVDEQGDFKNRPGTRASIDYLLSKPQL